MTLTPTVLLIVCPLALLAGFIDSIAGGGGMISLPAYYLAGLPPALASGTNKLSAMMGKRGCSMLCFTDLPLAARFAAALAEELPGWKETAELLAQREDKRKRRKAAPRKHTESGKRRK